MVTFRPDLALFWMLIGQVLMDLTMSDIPLARVSKDSEYRIQRSGVYYSCQQQNIGFQIMANLETVAILILLIVRVAISGNIYDLLALIVFIVAVIVVMRWVIGNEAKISQIVGETFVKDYAIDDLFDAAKIVQMVKPIRLGHYFTVISLIIISILNTIAANDESHL